jgi:hypothetical protein
MAVEIKEKHKTKPRAHHENDCELDYLIGPTNILFENGILVPREDFDMWKKEHTLSQHLEYLADDPEANNYDYAYALTTGTLRRKKGTADLVASARTEKRRGKEVQKVKEIVVEEQKKEAVRRYIFSSAFLVTLVMIVVGVGSAVMSAYHTSTFLFQGGKPLWTSVMTGTMLVIFSGTAFTAARYFLQEKGALAVFGCLFIITGLVVIMYSMFSTLVVNFNQFKWQDDAQAVTTVEGSEALAAHRERIHILEGDIDNATHEIGRLEGESEYWRNRSWARYDEAVQQLAVITEHRRILQEQRVELVGETPRLVEVEAVSQETIYGFLANLFKIKEDAMRFFVYAIPACLYDILAPFALSVVLLLFDKRGKNIDDERNHRRHDGKENRYSAYGE